MIELTMQVHAVADQMPDCDTDVLLFEGLASEGTIGAYVAHDADGPQWAGAQGHPLYGVTHWAALPWPPAP